MASYVAKTTTKEKREEKLSQMKSVFSPRGFLSFEPWVLVPEGSLMGYFDWVPLHLRHGPWSSLSAVCIAAMCTAIIYLKPDKSLINNRGESSSVFPDAFSLHWYYDATLFVWLSGVLLFLCVNVSPFVIVTYTVQSWTLQIVRHGLCTLAPFLPTGHVLLHVNELLRFPALVTASLTFMIWNFILCPFIVLHVHDTSVKRRKFLAWNFNGRMTQLHVGNIFYAIMNNVVGNDARFAFDDLWIALALGTLYALFYLLVLDRIGVHLYPIFSPRTKSFPLLWFCVFVCYAGIFKFWNMVIAHELVSAMPLFITFLLLVAACTVTSKVLSATPLE